MFVCVFMCMQGQCGASYAFSAMGALEGAWALANGKLTTLSEQNIIDCSGQLSSNTSAPFPLSRNFASRCVDTFLSVSHTVAYGNHGCNGGNMYNAFRYVVATGGVDTQTSYPFQGRVR